MAARGEHPVAARGGDIVQALRPARARLIPALLALACAAGAGGYAVALGGRFAGGTVAVVAVGLALLALGLVLRWPNTVPWSVVTIACGYVIARSGHVTVDGWAAVVGTALLAAAELATWSIEHDARIPEEPSVRNRRIATLVALLLGALLLDLLVLTSAAVSGSSSLLLAAIGVAAAVAAVGVVLRLVRTA